MTPRPLALALTLTLGAASALAEPVTTAAMEVPVAAPATDVPGQPSLRELAEIDGDPATFTGREQEKHALLIRLLGADPTQH